MTPFIKWSGASVTLALLLGSTPSRASLSLEDALAIALRNRSNPALEPLRAIDEECGQQNKVRLEDPWIGLGSENGFSYLERDQGAIPTWSVREKIPFPSKFLYSSTLSSSCERLWSARRRSLEQGVWQQTVYAFMRYGILQELTYSSERELSFAQSIQKIAERKYQMSALSLEELRLIQDEANHLTEALLLGQDEQSDAMLTLLSLVPSSGLGTGPFAMPDKSEDQLLPQFENLVHNSGSELFSVRGNPEQEKAIQDLVKLAQNHSPKAQEVHLTSDVIDQSLQLQSSFALPDFELAYEHSWSGVGAGGQGADRFWVQMSLPLGFWLAGWKPGLDRTEKTRVRAILEETADSTTERTLHLLADKLIRAGHLMAFEEDLVNRLDEPNLNSAPKDMPMANEKRKPLLTQLHESKIYYEGLRRKLQFHIQWIDALTRLQAAAGIPISKLPGIPDSK